MNHKEVPHRILQVLFLIGGALVIINFFQFRSLWLDESALALNVVDKTASELTAPLDHNQVAPIGFLMIEKLFMVLFGNLDWALRIFPLICFFLSYSLMLSLSKSILQNKAYSFLAAAFFGTSYYILYYSSEVKQYISDTTVCLLVLSLTMSCWDKVGFKKLLPYALLGVVTVWFSNISIILLFPSGLLFLYGVYRNKNYLDAVWVLGAWLASFAFYYLKFIHNHPTQEMMLAYWDNAGAFIPQNVLSLEFFQALLSKTNSLFSLFGYQQLGLVLLPLFAVGAYSLYHLNKKILFLLGSPIVLHLLLSYLRVYPFDLRLILYLHPLLVIGVVAGLSHIFRHVAILHSKPAGYLLIVPILFNFVLLEMRGFPTKNEEIKDSLAFMEGKVASEDQLYVYDGAHLPFQFYQKTDRSLIQVNEENILLAEEHRDNWPLYEEEILKLDDSVWVLFSHIYWGVNSDGLTEEDYIVNLFKKNGYVVSDEKKYVGSSIYHLVKQ